MAVLGQLAAVDGELPAELRAELETLITSPGERDFSAVQADLRSALGPATLQIFAWLDPVPLARGWLGQAHLAKLSGGSRVAVHVGDRRYAGDVEQAHRSLRRAARWLRPWLSRRARRQLVRDARDAVQRESDLKQRARTLESVASGFAQDPRIVVPRVYLDVSSAALLVTEQIDATPLAAPEALAVRGGDARDCAALLCEAWGRLLFERGLHQSDARPLEIGIADDEAGAAPRLVLGCAERLVTLPPELRTCLRQAFAAASLADDDGLLAALEDAGVLPRGRRAAAEPLVRELLESAGAPGGEPNTRTAETLERVAWLVASEPTIFRLPPALIAYGQTLRGVIGLAGALAPGTDARTLLLPHAHKFLGAG